MSIVQFEIDEIEKLCENVVPNSKIIVLYRTTPGQLVRVDIIENPINCQLTVCLRFPSDYPKQPILIELKSRTLSERFLNGLLKLCDMKAKDLIGKPQGLQILKFVQKYLQNNPLCVCIDEIHQLRQDLGPDTSVNQLKLKQSVSTIKLIAKSGAYYYQVCAIIPTNYPENSVILQNQESNLPAVLLRFLNGQSKEIARQCVEPPLRLLKSNGTRAEFKPVPSLYRSLKFCLEATRDFAEEKCPICDKNVLPSDPKNVVVDDLSDAFVERVYCGHLFHQSCLKTYLREPPFNKDGKICPAKQRHPRSDATFYLGGIQGKSLKVLEEAPSKCGMRLAHDRWVISVKVAESRWAQKQARQRELEEVVEFLK